MTTAWCEAPKRVLNIAQNLMIHHPDICDLNFAFVLKDTESPSAGYGGAALFPEKLKPIVNFDYDFLIWIDGYTAYRAGDEFLTAVIDHQLCHCRYNAEKRRLYIAKHDVEEFTAVIKRNGSYLPSLTFAAEAFAEQPSLLPRQELARGTISSLDTTKIKMTYVGRDGEIHETPETDLRTLQAAVNYVKGTNE